MIHIHFDAPQKELVDMTDFELLKTVVNRLSESGEIQERTIQILGREVALLKKENRLLRKLYNLKAGE